VTSDVSPSSPALTGRYQLVEVVGRGGMGEVWAARDLRLGRDVAVKVLSPQMAAPADVRERFESEARAAARLNHPNVVSVYDSGEHDGLPYLVMELLPGRTLADELAAGPLPPERVRAIGTQILAALGASHRAGILHRDIKPGNVLLAIDGTVKVGDFGIAKSVDGLDLTTAGMIVGTVAYLAPERLEGQPATPQSDLYAVGVVLYEALTGRAPYRADTPLGLIRAIDAHAPVPLVEAAPGVDAALVGTVERAMAKDPARRFSTAAVMAAALRSDPAETVAMAPPAATVAVAVPIPNTEATTVRSPEPAQGIRDRWLQHRPRIIVGTVAALSVLLLAGLFASRIGSSSTSPNQNGAIPASTPSNGGSVPAGLEEPLKALERAVRP